jgi:hypothetical protein
MIHRYVRYFALLTILMALAISLPQQAGAKTKKFKQSEFSAVISDQNSTRNPAWMGAAAASSGAAFYAPVRLEPGAEITGMRI